MTGINISNRNLEGTLKVWGCTKGLLHFNFLRLPSQFLRIFFLGGGWQNLCRRNSLIKWRTDSLPLFMGGLGFAKLRKGIKPFFLNGYVGFLGIFLCGTKLPQASMVGRMDGQQKLQIKVTAGKNALALIVKFNFIM